MTKDRLLIFIPTYNEHENVEKIYGEIKSLGISADILFIDDNSPDGTGRIIDELAVHDKGVYAIHRPAKLGIGSAHKEGISFAYNNSYKLLLTMDCDFTHKTEYIREFIKFADDYDIVVGSRYMEERSLEDWNLQRRFLTHFGHFLTKFLLCMPYDATGAYRLYRLDRIRPEIFKIIHSSSYSFFFESLYVLFLNGLKIKEIPIMLPRRCYGHSKMKLKDVFTSVFKLWNLCVRSLLYRRSYILKEKTALDMKSMDWDAYWRKASGKKGPYAILARIYRKFIISRAVRHYFKKFFNDETGSIYLHAGCGSGESDSRIGFRDATFIKMDLSLEALELARSMPDHKKVHYVCGDIFNPPFKEGAFKGIWNLGVMEHFREDDIVAILKQSGRVLDNDGRLMLFWPPKYGLSVMVLSSVIFLADKIFGRTLKLYPDECSRFDSREWAGRLFKEARLNIDKAHFNIRDLFTYVVVVGEKGEKTK
ncbi:MAG: glycosyltransferase [Candidatus Omnitrophica bacterium]|nr:glycosyltransferase [Candidatus Omnitrophota bacterium]